VVKLTGESCNAFERACYAVVAHRDGTGTTVLSFPACGAGDLLRIEGHVLALARKIADGRAQGRNLRNSSALDSL
jgi:hypothetical protein